MGLISAANYQRMREREVAGEEDVFFRFKRKNKVYYDLDDYIPILPPRVRRRVKKEKP